MEAAADETKEESDEPNHQDITFERLLLLGMGGGAGWAGDAFARQTAEMRSVGEEGVQAEDEGYARAAAASRSFSAPNARRKWTKPPRKC